MPGTTPVYGFPYPEPTDLIADYPAIGQQLAEDIEDVLPTIGGMTLINPTSIANSGGTASTTNGVTTFTTVTSISLNGVFSATYDNYRILFEGLGSSLGAGLYVRMRASGTDATANYYYANTYVRVTGTITAAGGNNAAFGSFNVGLSTNRGASSTTADVVKPFEAMRTSILGIYYGGDGTGPFAGQVGVALDNSTSYDGITLYPSAGTTTGTVSVYGYKGA